MTHGLSDSELEALELLAQKNAGEDVAFINIAAARTLTDLGLATRRAGGWEITPQGRNHLLRETSQELAEGAANAR